MFTKHTYIRTHRHTHTHIYICAGVDIIKRYKLMHRDSPVLTYTHTHIHAHIMRYPYTKIWTALSDIRDSHVLTVARIHTYPHTYIYTHIDTLDCIKQYIIGY